MKELRNIKIGLLLPHLLSDTDKILIQVLNEYIRKDIEVLSEKKDYDTRYFYYYNDDIIYEMVSEYKCIFICRRFFDLLKTKVEYSDDALGNFIKAFILYKHNSDILEYRIDIRIMTQDFYSNLKQKLLNK